MAETTKQSLPNNSTYQSPIRIASRAALGSLYPTVKAIPNAGATITVQYTTSTADDLAAGTAVWDTWPAGSVTVNASDTLLGAVTAVRAMASGGTGTLEVCQ